MARSTLGAELPATLENSLEDGLVAAYLRRLTNLEVEKTIGAKATMRLVVANAALFDVLLTAGLERPEAIDMIYRINCTVSASYYRFLYRLSRVVGRSATKRMNWVSGVMNRWYPFSSPGWKLKPIPQHEIDSKVVAYDYCRCPIAEYCAPRDLVDLCTGALCSLDYLFEEPSGLELVREVTLVEGGDLCTFRWCSK